MKYLKFERMQKEKLHDITKTKTKYVFNRANMTYKKINILILFNLLPLKI